MKKKLLILLMLIICLFSFFACGENFDFGPLEGGPKENDAIVANFGTCVQKGDYIYMINGLSEFSEDNNFGAAIKGAIYRLKVDTNGEIKESLRMAPKAFYCREQGSGLFLHGNKLFYMSSSMQKDKDGGRLMTYYDVFSVNLDGTGTKRLGTFEDMTKIKFFVEDSKVYVVFELKEKVYLLSEEGRISTLITEYTSVIVGDDNCIYYTKEVKRDTDSKISGIEDYNMVYKKPILGNEEEVKLGTENLSQSLYSVQLQEFKDGVLYYSKNIKAGSNPLNLFFAYRNGAEIQLTSSEQTNPYFLGFDGNKYLGTLFLKDNNILLIEATESGVPGGFYFIAGGVSGQPTYLFMDKSANELYFSLNNKLYKVKVLDGSNNPAESKTEQLLDVNINIEKLFPKKLGNFVYYVGSGDKDYYTNYLFRMDLRKPKDQEPVRLGELSKADQELKEKDEKK